MSAKYDDLKYPFFKSFREVFIRELQDENVDEEDLELARVFNPLNYEVFILKCLNFNLTVPSSVRFFDRYSRAAGF